MQILATIFIPFFEPVNWLYKTFTFVPKFRQMHLKVQFVVKKLFTCTLQIQTLTRTTCAASKNEQILFL